MELEEIKNYLKNNLSLNIETKNQNFDDSGYIEIQLKLEDEVISDVNIDKSDIQVINRDW